MCLLREIHLKPGKIIDLNMKINALNNHRLILLISLNIMEKRNMYRYRENSFDLTSRF